MKSLSLKEWIDQLGVTEVAKLLKTKRPTVWQWRRGYCMPRPKYMALISKYSKGTVSFEAVLNAHLKEKARRTRELSKVSSV